METVRIASIVQKGLATGRSSYVEMRALGRLTSRNVKLQVQATRSLLNESDKDISEVLSRILSAITDGYTSILTPNGIVRKNELDRLISIDSEIVTCLGLIESRLEYRSPENEGGELTSETVTIAGTLNELLDERKKLLDTFKV